MLLSEATSKQKILHSIILLCSVNVISANIQFCIYLVQKVPKHPLILFHTSVIDTSNFGLTPVHNQAAR